MRPIPSLTPAAEELIELRLMRDMLREALDLPNDAPVSTITAEARTAIFLMQAEDAFRGRAA